MENLVDIFSGDAFSVRALTDAINIVPVQYGRVNKLGLFAEKGVNTSIVSIEMNNGVLNLIPSTKRGDPAPKNKTGKRSAKPLTIPHFPLDDLILPDDIQNVRAFGSTNLMTPTTVTNDRLVDLARKHDITNEWLKCGSISGIIKDADGSTLLNLFTEFGVTELEVDFELDDDTTVVQEKVAEVLGHMEDNLAGDQMTHAHAFCSPGFWAAFIIHKSVQAAYANYQNMVNTIAGPAAASGNALRDDVRKGFYFGGIVWEEYRGKANNMDANGASTSRAFIDADKVRFVPVGTTETFRHYNAPANWMETVNTVGLPKYAKVVPENGGRFVEVLSQSNPLPLCLRPALLVKGKKF